MSIPSGRHLLDALGRRVLMPDGKAHVANGVKDDCCCQGTTPPVAVSCLDCGCPDTLNVTISSTATCGCPDLSGTYVVPRAGTNPCIYLLNSSVPVTAWDSLQIYCQGTGLPNPGQWAIRGYTTSLDGLYACKIGYDPFFGDATQSFPLGCVDGRPTGTVIAVIYNLSTGLVCGYATVTIS
jgi:hypothetical protein